MFCHYVLWCNLALFCVVSMAEFLLEVMSEEIPASMQRGGALFLSQLLSDRLSQGKASSSVINSPVVFDYFYSSCRIAIYSRDASRLFCSSLVRGPKEGASDAAIDGFAKKMMVQTRDLIIEKSETGASFYFARQSEDMAMASLTDCIEKCLCSMQWPRTLAWDHTNVEWVRPVRNILCIFDGKPLHFNFGDVRSGNKTFGHRLSEYRPIEVSSIEDYINQLRNNLVIIDPEERRVNILTQLGDSADRFLRQDLPIGSAEFPVVIRCNVDPAFENMPRELIEVAHNSCDGVLRPNNVGGEMQFFVVTNNPSPGPNIIKGYERAVNTKLADLSVLWEADMAHPIELLSARCASTTYHEKLGSYADKISRIVGLAKYIAMLVPYASIVEVENLAAMSKLAISMSITREYPELQCVALAHYMSRHGYSGADTMEIYGKLINFHDPERIPYNAHAVSMALADMLDNILGSFAVGNIPTTSKDPWRLKKMADSVIEIILFYKLERLHISMLLGKNTTFYHSATKLFARDKFKDIKVNRKAEVNRNALEFIMSRAKLMLTEKYSTSVYKAVFTEYLFAQTRKVMENDDLAFQARKAQDIYDFISSDKGVGCIASYKRAYNIAIEKKAFNSPSKRLCSSESEIALFESLKSNSIVIKQLMKRRLTQDALDVLSNISRLLDNFLDNTMINVDAINLRNNRLALLKNFLALARSVCNFDGLIS